MYVHHTTLYNSVTSWKHKLTKVLLPALQRITQKPNSMSESVVQTVPKFQQFGATITVTESLFHA